MRPIFIIKSALQIDKVLHRIFVFKWSVFTFDIK